MQKGKGRMKKLSPILHLVLTHDWFDMIARGEKRVEYRTRSDHWDRLIGDRKSEITHVRFRRGYSQKTLKFRVDEIDEGRCPIPGWDDIYYRIHFS